MVEPPGDNKDFPELPWEIESDLMEKSGLSSDHNIVDLVIARYLASGDPRPFSWWVLNGYRPSDSVITLLANMLNPVSPIDDRFPYTFQPKQRHPKRGHPPKGPEDKLRDLLVALSVQKKLYELGPGTYDAVLIEVAEWVGISVSMAKRAYETYSKALPPLDQV